MNYEDSGLKKIFNPPFKSFIDYRIGDYNTFRKAMLNLIKERGLSEGSPILKSDKRDYGRTFVEMWAYLCDILTYYQERIATESFIRTAGLEESVIELLYLVDYLPRRGRSASTLVRFVANEKNIPPTESVTIPKSFKIRSVPAKGQEAIIFETDEPLIVSPDHNLMKLEGWRTSYSIEKGSTQVILDKIYPELNVGDLIMISDDKDIDVIRIAKKVDKEEKSQISWSEDESVSKEYLLSKTKIQKFTQVVRPFGYNAPPSILSNVGLTLYKKKNSSPRDNGSGGGSGGDAEPNREPVSGRRVQLIDVSDRVIATATSDKDGKFTFKGLTPGSYRIFIARSQILADESLLHPITTIPTNHFQLLPGYESWFEAELEFGGREIQNIVSQLKDFFSHWKDFSSRLAQNNPFAGQGLSQISDSFLQANNLENIANDILPDMRPSINLKPKEPYPFDPVNDDILSSKVYLDKLYGNVRQGSFVILSKDDPSSPIDISKQLFKVSRTGQIFYAKYGIGANSTTINLQTLDGTKEAADTLIFIWDDIVEEIKKIDQDSGEEAQQQQQIKNLIEFLKQDNPSLDAKTYTFKMIDNDKAIQITDQDKTNLYLVKLNEKEEGKATLFKKDKKLLDFVVKKDREKAKLYAGIIESAFYKIRNTLIFTNPNMEIAIDPRYASQDKTKENAEDITLEGMHTGLKDGFFLAVNDNTSTIKGRLVDSNLKPLKGHNVRVYRIQKQEPPPPSASTSTANTNTIAAAAASGTLVGETQETDDTGSFTFDDLRADSYLVSLSLPLKRYWLIFVDNIFREKHNGDEEQRGEIIKELLPPNPQEQKRDYSSSGSGTPRPSEEKKDHKYSVIRVLEDHIDAFFNIITMLDEKRNKLHEKSMFAAHTKDIGTHISQIITLITSIKQTKLPLIVEAGSIEAS